MNNEVVGGKQQVVMTEGFKFKGAVKQLRLRVSE